MALHCPIHPEAVLDPSSTIFLFFVGVKRKFPHIEEKEDDLRMPIVVFFSKQLVILNHTITFHLLPISSVSYNIFQMSNHWGKTNLKTCLPLDLAPFPLDKTAGFPPTKHKMVCHLFSGPRILNGWSWWTPHLVVFPWLHQPHSLKKNNQKQKLSCWPSFLSYTNFYQTYLSSILW